MGSFMGSSLHVYKTSHFIQDRTTRDPVQSCVTPLGRIPPYLGNLRSCLERNPGSQGQLDEESFQNKPVCHLENVISIFIPNF